MTTYNLSFFLYYSGGYHLLDRNHIAAAGVSYSRGVSDELDLQKSSVTLRLFDDDDYYRPSNPESALYGIIGQYLPWAYTVDGAARAAGELETLTADQTDSHTESAGATVTGSRWVDVRASGPLASVGRWREAVSSPMRLFITGLTTLVNYWPGEDADGSALMSAVRGTAAAVSGVTFAAADGPAGSNPLLTLGASGLVDGVFTGGSYSTSAWQISWTTDMAGADGSERTSFSWQTSNGWRWNWMASTSTYRIRVTDTADNVLLDDGIANGGVGPGVNVVFRMKCTRSSTTWTVAQAWWQEGDTVLIGTTSTFSNAAATCRPASWSVQASTIMSGAYLGHVFAVTTAAEDLQSTQMLETINGYPGESTVDRFERICALRGITTDILGDTATATLQGPQRSGTIKAQLQEILRTEQGLIFESAAGRGLVLALRSYLQEQASDPVLTLTCPDDCRPPKEAPTTAELYNTIIAEDRSGLSATAVQSSGRYGTADPPDGCGIVDKTISVNLFAGSEVALAAGSYLAYHQQEQRFGEITVDLDANPALVSAVDDMDIGMCISLVGRTPDPVVLMVTGVSGVDARTRRIVTFTTVPAAHFVTTTWDATVPFWDLATCTLSVTATSTATSLTLAITADESWSTTDEPYDLMIAGERVTVTSMGTRTGSAGAYQQIATVTRSVNGVSKAQTAGAPVVLADSKRWAW